MDRDRVKAMLEEARAELTTARSSITYLEQVVNGLEGVLRTSALPTPPANPPTAETPPVKTPSANGSASPTAPSAGEYLKSPDAVMTILRQHPNRPMRFPAVWKQIVAAGLNDPSIKSGINAYQNSARRLAADPASPVERDSEGRYMYRTDSTPTSEGTLALGPVSGLVGVPTS